ncbi:MAG: hypothetical protein ACLT0W_12205, partial [Clostridium sp.]
AKTIFEESVACIGAHVCQQGIRDSQGLLQKLVGMERNEQFADGILPKIHISGCPSSCGYPPDRCDRLQRRCKDH